MYIAIKIRDDISNPKHEQERLAFNIVGAMCPLFIQAVERIMGAITDCV